MKTILFTLHELGYTAIDLGKHGENGVREIDFDLREWIAEYPGAGVALYISQPNTTVYLAATKLEEGILKWPILNTYTATPGFGSVEIVMSGKNGERLKSATANIFVSESMSEDEQGEAPKYMKPYADQVAENAAKAEKALEEIKNISVQSGNMPTGGDPGQILAKKSEKDYDAHWVNAPNGGNPGSGGSGLPSGGSSGQTLVKQSTADGDAIWKKLTASDVGALGKNETAANAASLNGKRADQYALKTDLPTKASDIGALPSDGTAADSAKLDGKDSVYYLGARNLLDNSDFTNPVNQRGQTSYDQTSVSGYTIDRWRAQYSMLTVNDGYVTWKATAIAQYKRLIQWIGTPIEAGKTYTIAMLAKVKTNPVLATFRPIDNTSVMSGASSFTISGTTADCQWFVHSFTPTATPAKPGMEIFVSNTTDHTFEADIKCMAFYEGSYTAETLPPYAPKEAPTEYLACRTYFKRFALGTYNGFITNGATRVYIPINDWAMRIMPTATMNGVEIFCRTISGYATGSDSANKIYPKAIGVSGNNVNTNVYFEFDAAIGTNNTPVCIQIVAGYFDLSADL